MGTGGGEGENSVRKQKQGSRTLALAVWSAVESLGCRERASMCQYGVPALRGKKVCTP